MKYKVSQGQIIEEEVIKNLLEGHRKAARSGDVQSLMRITKYLMRLAYKRKDVLFDVGSEVNDSDSSQPPEEG